MKHLLSNFLKSIFLLFVISISFIKCGDTETEHRIDPAFSGYITAFTSGIVSNQSTIKIRLAEPYLNARPNEETNENLFDFSPNIEGEAYWIDEQTIEFIPKEKLPSGKLFEGEFYLSKLMKVADKLETLVFQFQVMKQAIEVNFEGMESHSTKDLKLQMIHASALTYDYAKSENIEKSISATQNGNKLNIIWEHGTDGKIHNFTIENIKRSDNRSQVVLQWTGEYLGFDEDGENIFEIPPLGEFSVLDINITQQPEQFVTIYFSDPIKQEQDLEGLILFNPATNFRIIKDINSIKLYPTSRLSGNRKLVITDAILNVMNYKLISKFEQDITFENIKPAIELIGKGNILPSSNGLYFPFKSVNLKAINVKIIKVFENNIAQFLQVNQFDGTRGLKRVGRIVYKGEIQLKTDKAIDYGSWNKFSIDLSEFIKTDPGAIYRVQLSFTKQQSLYPCEDNSEDDNSSYSNYDIESESYDSPSDYWEYYDDETYYNQEYNWQEKENPCKSSYYRGKTVSKNILASDIGIIAKGGHSNLMTVAITDIKTTKPMSGVTIEMYNFQNQLIGSSITDNNGILQIDLKNKPFLLIARKDKQRGYLRLDDGSALSLSMFDIGGEKIQRGIKGYIYGERGVWRPGDSLFISFILEDKNHVLPKNHPVVFELYTPEQQLYERKLATNSVNGFYTFKTSTLQDDPTGNWQARVKIGGSTFYKKIKIETTKPNRLKIKLNFGDKYLSEIKKPNGKLEVKWLHGAIAANLKVDIELTLKKGDAPFKKYKDYSFDDPSKDFYSDEEIVFDGKVDTDGKATIQPKIQITNNAPGMLQAFFKIRAFEKGGDFSVDRFSLPYSPYRGYVGVKIPKGKGWNGALYSNEPNLIPIITVDEEGNLIDRKGLIIEVYNVYWRWWWEHSNENNLSRYVSNKSKNLVKTDIIDTKNGKALYELNLGERSYGRKFIRITDPVTGHSVGEAFYVTYKGWWDNNDNDSPGGAEMLTFSTDKTKYNVGDKIKVNIPTAKQGRTLVSIEAGSKILETFWLEMQEGNNKFEIDATEEMAPNIFINLTLIQPHNNVKNDLPIRLYGVQSVSIEDPNSHLEPQIYMPKVLVPEKKFTVKVSEKSGKKMTYTLAVVDDGLLDLTRYKTPDPWSHFYAKEALSVHTWDMYKYVIGSFSGEMAGLLAIGGDEYAPKDGGAKANRFKPVVKFIGPFELNAGGSNSHTILMPNYIGSVRTMVIAGDKKAYGSSEKTTPVKKPLMVLASLPRVVGPGEKVKLPVTVFAMDSKIKDVTVTVQTNSILKINESKTKKIHFSREGDKVVNFNIDVTDKLGVGKVTVTVKSGSLKSSYNIELNVRASNPKVTDVIDAVIEPGASWESNYIPIGMKGTNKGIIEVSSIPSLKLQERLKYLIQYPHGCVEQTTSSAFPQLFLNNLLKLNSSQKAEIEENIKTTINKLKTFQIFSGGLSYWPGENDRASEWGTNYAGHFMLEAKLKGYTVSSNFLSKWISFQKQRANSWTNDLTRTSSKSSQLIQAYRLYTLALAKSPSLGAMNRLKSERNLSNSAKWRLAAAYYLVGKKKIAEGLISDLTTDVPNYRELSYSFGSTQRDKAMILETLTMLGQNKKAKIIIDELAKNMSSNRWYSTQTTSFTLLAVAKFVGVTGNANENVKFEYILNDAAKKSVISKNIINQIDLKIQGKNGGKVKIINTGAKTLFVKIQLEGIPMIGDKTNAENDLKMSVRYLTLDGVKIDPSKLDQGTDFIAEVKVTHPGLRDDYKEMALTQIFASGWEIRNTRMDETFNNDTDIPRYQNIRDDRVLTYFDLKRGESKTFRIIINASYLGKFYLPTVYCEAMYDHNINARIAGEWVSISIPGE